MGLKDLEQFAQQEAETSAQSQAVNQSLTRGLDENPDEYAKLLKISAQTGIAPDLAKDYRPELERRTKLESLSVDDLVRSNPKTSRFLSDPTNASVAHDDVSNLSTLEQVLLKPVDYTRSGVQGVVGQGLGSTLSGAGELYNVAARGLERLLDQVLPNSVMSTLRTPVPWFMDPGQVLKRPGQSFKDIGEVIAVPKERQGLDTDVASGVGQLGFQIAQYLLTGGTLTTASMYAQGADVMATKTAKDDADPALRDTAILAGGAITALTERYGLDKILNRMPPEIKNRTLRFIADKVAAGGIEAGQEITEGLLHDLTRRVLTDENAPLLEGALKEGTVAALSAAIVRSALGVRSYREAKQQEEVIKALSGDSKLRERLPEKYREFVAQVTEGGPVQNAFIPVEQFNKFFQSQGMDPVQAAEQFGVKNYDEAVGLGADVVIPMDRFAADLAPTDYLQGLAQDIKFDQGGMTPRERDLYLANQDSQDAEIDRIIAEQDAQGGVIRAIQEIVTDVEGQLVSVGTDARTARTQATALRGVAVLVERDLRARAEANGEQVTDEQVLDAVRQVWKGYGLDISRPLPEILTTNPQGGDISIDPLLDAIRAGAFPTQQEVLGNSLVEFIRSKGGLAPRGELVDVDWNNRPFQKNLVQRGGMSIERAATLAVEAGYFPGMQSGEITETDLLDALDSEIRGDSATFSSIETDNDALGMLQSMNSLAEYLASLNIDLNVITDNAQVRALIDAARNTPELEGLVGQFDQLVQQLAQRQQGQLPEQIDVDGVMRPTTNSNGQPIAQNEEGVRNFWRFFGDSQVVDEQGRPLVTYHASTSPIDEFKPKNYGTAGDHSYFYFAASESWSKKFAKESLGVDKPSMHKVYLSIQNPLDLRGEARTPSQWVEFFDGIGVAVSDKFREKLDAAPAKQEIAAWQLLRFDTPENGAMRERLIEAGYDGIVMSDVVRGKMDNTTFVSFQPTQIKSATGNDGSFDPANPNILYQGKQAQQIDAEYLAAVERGDMDAAQKMVDQAARAAGYISGTDYRMSHQAPNSKSDVSLADLRESGLVPDDYWTKPEWYQSTPEERASWEKVTKAFRTLDAKSKPGKPYPVSMTVYRAVPKDVKDGSIRNGDWITPSLEYAKMEGANIPGGYRVISQQVLVKDLYWDGNSIAELGYDDGNNYAYKNTKNNRKLMDVVTRDEDGNIIPLSKRFNTRSEDVFFQSDDLSDKRGYIQFGPDRKFNIVLLEQADLSTFLHETGHFYLEVLGDLATAEGASAQIKDDYAKVLKFLGLESRDQLTLDNKAPGSAEFARAVEAHEKWARANEAYLMEGHAPAPELRDVFQRFKSWMLMIYRSMASLNVELTNEVREVFDRVYATDVEIQAAKSEVNVDPLFLDAATAGMTQAEFEVYRASVAQATESGKEALTAKLMREYMRERKMWWKEAEQDVRKEVTQEIDSQPVYQAFKALVAGKMDDDTEIKLNKNSLIKKYGAEYVKRLPRGFQRIYTNKGGMDADAAAEFLGYESGDKLVEALVGMRDRNELIKAETALRMRVIYGDLKNDGKIADEARIALHNSQRENVLMAELRALRRKQREVAPFVKLERDKAKEDRRNARAAAQTPPAEAFRRAAIGLVGQTPVRDLDPNRYLMAARRAAKQAFDAMSKGDYMLAADAKQKELLNHFMYLEANKARQQADKILKYATKFESGTTREQMGKAGGTYLEQIDAILDRYEFRRVPLSKLDRRASLSEWIAEQEALGLEPSIGAELLNETRKVNYREVSIDELRAIYDAVRNIEHLARLKNKLITKQKEIAFDDAIAELVAAAENMTAGKGAKSKGQRKMLPLDMSAMTMREKGADQVTRLDAMLLKMEQVVEWLDNGDVNGPWHTYLWNPIAEAQTREYDLTRDLTERLSKALEAMPKEQRLGMLDTFEIPGMGKVTRKFIISVALNMGNQGNIDKMMRGMGWDIGTIDRALAKLNDADWTFVQETWDTINSVWPEIAALEKRMTGLEPPRVEAQPYQVRDQNGEVVRTLPGGYYPLVYDPRLSEQGAKQEAGNLGQLFEEGYVRATTPKGHTQARMEGFAAPLLLDFEQVVTQHMAKVVKDLTHREAVITANKILTNREIRSVLQETMGPAYEKQFLPWLRSVVNDRNGGSVQGLTDFSRWMMTARANIVAATMGFKATTMIAQITGISQSLDKVKGRYIGEALRMYLRHPIATTRQVRELSGEMRNRSNTLDRDIRDQLRNLTGQNSTWAKAQRFAFHGIAIADAMVTIPTWMGAYRQSLDEGKDESTARLEADAAVRLTQGGAGAKDLAAIQRNNELAKAVTMFYSYFSVLYNRQRDMGRDVQEIRDMPRFLSRVFFTIMVPAVMGELILGRGPDEDEEPEEWVIRKVLLYPLMSVPVLRDVASAIDSGYDYRFSPMASVFDKIGKAATSTGKLFEGDIDWDQYALRVAETIGFVFGVAGTAQISATGKYLWRVNEGEENPDNIAELLAYALLGKRKED